MSQQAWKVVKEDGQGHRDNWTLHAVEPNGDLGGWLVSMQTCFAHDDEEREFDAATMRLIAAAPDLLAALHEAILEAERLGNSFPGDSLLRMKAAIAKATEAA